MTFRSLILFIAFLSVLGFAHRTAAQKKVPELWGHRVHDDAKLLSESTVEYLERRLKAFEDSTSNQIAILTINSLNGENIEQYALRIAEKWKLGDKRKDNGALLVVAVNDRQMRIEVGKGLEGPLPDAICNRIIRNEMSPAFRRGDFDSGVMAAVDAIMLAIKGEYKSDGPRSIRSGGNGRFILTIFIFLVYVSFRYFTRSRGRSSGWSSGAGWFIGGSGWGGSSRGGGGGWSGGGGSFGGGGSSGSW